jgi:hypothetical protein
VTDRNVQLQVVSAYWRLSASIAHYRVAYDEYDLLARLPKPEGRRQAVGIEAAKTGAAARLRESELNVVSMQSALAELTSHRTTGDLVLPTDLPFVGAYRTHFESLFAGRPAPAGLQRIDRILPLRLAVIDARAAAVEAAEESVRLTEAAFKADDAELNGLLETVAQLRAERHAFISAVRDYNIDIAAYALAVAGSNVGHETLVSMLIETTPRVGSALISKHQTLEVASGGTSFAAGQQRPTPAAVGADNLQGIPPRHKPGDAQKTVPVGSVPSVGAAANPAGHNGQSNTPADDPTESPFRDVTPSEPSRPEVLVPTPRARYQQLPIPPGTPAGTPPTRAVHPLNGG